MYYHHTNMGDLHLFKDRFVKRIYMYTLILMGLTFGMILTVLIIKNTVISQELNLENIYPLIIILSITFATILLLMIWSLYRMKKRMENNPEASQNFIEKKEDPLHYKLYKFTFTTLITIASITMTGIWISGFFLDPTATILIDIYFILYWMSLIPISLYMYFWLANKKEQYENGIQVHIEKKEVKKEFMKEIEWIYEDLKILDKKNQRKQIKEMQRHFMNVEQKYFLLLEDDFYTMHIVDELETVRKQFAKKLSKPLRILNAPQIKSEELRNRAS